MWGGNPTLSKRFRVHRTYCPKFKVSPSIVTRFEVRTYSVFLFRVVCVFKINLLLGFCMTDNNFTLVHLTSLSNYNYIK